MLHPEGGGRPDVRSTLATSLRVGDALHRVDGNAVRSGDSAHAWTILLAQIGEDRAFDVGIDLAPSELLSLALGPPPARRSRAVCPNLVRAYRVPDVCGGRNCLVCAYLRLALLTPSSHHPINPVDGSEYVQCVVLTAA